MYMYSFIHYMICIHMCTCVWHSSPFGRQHFYLLLLWATALDIQHDFLQLLTLLLAYQNSKNMCILYVYFILHYSLFIYYMRIYIIINVAIKYKSFVSLYHKRCFACEIYDKFYFMKQLTIQYVQYYMVNNRVLR